MNLHDAHQRWQDWVDDYGDELSHELLTIGVKLTHAVDNDDRPSIRLLVERLELITRKLREAADNLPPSLEELEGERADYLYDQWRDRELDGQ